MLVIEVVNRSGVEVEEDAAAELARCVLAGEGVDDGELGQPIGADPVKPLAQPGPSLGLDKFGTCA